MKPAAPSSDDPGTDPTLADARAETVSTLSGSPPRASNSRSAPGYQLGAELGRGGMGEVIAAADLRLGRDVALKRMRSTEPTPEELARFLREATIQARLDHPAIVPVFELGRDEEGRPYFTMKRLAGTTLAALLASGQATLQRLLRALVDVCLAIDLAHTKHIVHRDLKPPNIMLGDYGEVYVLDWGIARVIGEADDPPPAGASPTSATSHTHTGQLLGTPGYMAPEQVRGAPVGPPADVYALGAILFEILAGEPLHPRGSGAIASTLTTIDASPSARTPARAIPPELDAACTSALVEDPALRPTARQLGDRIQQYLDGDRDTERRRALASQLVADADAALATGDRGEAVRLTGRAFALDPDSEAAAALMVSLVLDPSDVIPPEVEQTLADEEAAAMSARSGRAFGPVLAFYLLTPFLPFLAIVDWLPLLGVYLSITLMTALIYVNWRIGRVPVTLWLFANLMTLTMFSRLTGPFVVTPALICAVLLSASAIPWLNQRPWTLALGAVLAVVAPFALEELGIFARSWTRTAHGVSSHGTIFAHDKGSMAPLFVANLMIIALVALYARGISRDRRVAQRRLHVQAWHLRQLLPRRSATRSVT